MSRNTIDTTKTNEILVQADIGADTFQTEVHSEKSRKLINREVSDLEAETLHSVAYNEMADVTVQMIDPVEEVRKNLAHLEELQARMRFMMKEIRYLLKV